MWKYKRIFFYLIATKAHILEPGPSYMKIKSSFFPLPICPLFKFHATNFLTSFDKDFKREIINTMIDLKTINNVGLENLINYISFYLNLKINYMSNNKTWG